MFSMCHTLCHSQLTKGPRGLGFHPERCRRAAAVPLGILALVSSAIPMICPFPGSGFLMKDLGEQLVMPRIKAGLKVQAVPLVHGMPVIAGMFGSAGGC